MPSGTVEQPVQPAPQHGECSAVSDPNLESPARLPRQGQDKEINHPVPGPVDSVMRQSRQSRETAHSRAQRPSPS
ncbi:hypothetical protein GPN2_21912 [Streptomyces murinus]